MFIFCVLHTVLFHSLMEDFFITTDDFSQVKVSYNNDTIVRAIVLILFVLSRKVLFINEHPFPRHKLPFLI